MPVQRANRMSHRFGVKFVGAPTGPARDRLLLFGVEGPVVGRHQQPSRRRGRQQVGEEVQDGVEQTVELPADRGSHLIARLPGQPRADLAGDVIPQASQERFLLGSGPVGAGVDRRAWNAPLH